MHPRLLLLLLLLLLMMLLLMLLLLSMLQAHGRIIDHRHARHRRLPCESSVKKRGKLLAESMLSAATKHIGEGVKHGFEKLCSSDCKLACNVARDCRICPQNQSGRELPLHVFVSVRGLRFKYQG